MRYSEVREIRFRIFVTFFIALALMAGCASAADVSFAEQQGNINNDSYLEVTFTGSISDATATEDSQWVWNFGDGSAVGTGQTVTHTYSADSFPSISEPLEYMIALNVTKDETYGGGTVSTSRLITLEEPELIGSFTASVTSGSYPLTVTFEDTTLGRHLITGWTFGDQSDDNPATATVTHTFETDDVYSVVLTVTRGIGETSTPSKDIIVTKPWPVALFTTNVTTGKAPLSVKFTDQSTIAAGNISGWSWNFGDYTSLSDDQNPEHTFQKPGNYTVVLTATGNGKSSTDERNIVVKNLTASFYADSDQRSGKGPLTVKFTSTSTGDITSYYWTFGDGKSDDTANPEHIFRYPGLYDIKLTITGPDGYKDSLTKEDYIEVSTDTPTLTATPKSTATTAAPTYDIDTTEVTTTAVNSALTVPGTKIFGIPGTEFFRTEIGRLYGFYKEYLYLMTHLS